MSHRHFLEAASLVQRLEYAIIILGVSETSRPGRYTSFRYTTTAGAQQGTHSDPIKERKLCKHPIMIYSRAKAGGAPGATVWLKCWTYSYRSRQRRRITNAQSHSTAPRPKGEAGEAT